MKKDEVLFYVEMPHFCCGIVANATNGRVVDAAPIMRWAVGKHLAPVHVWVKSKGGTVKPVSPADYEKLGEVQ